MKLKRNTSAVRLFVNQLVPRVLMKKTTLAYSTGTTEEKKLYLFKTVVFSDLVTSYDVAFNYSINLLTMNSKIFTYTVILISLSQFHMHTDAI